MPAAPASRPLFVRLRNWVGDVTLALPMLRRLSDAGHSLTLAGKGWARDLLAGEAPLRGWTVLPLPATARERIAQMRRWRAEAQARDAGLRGRIHALCLPDSFSSALEFRLAGLRALGHAWEGRGWLLGRAVARQRRVHELQVYWQLGDALLGEPAPLPGRIALQTTAEQRERAQALRAQHGIEAGCVLICPFAGGTWDKADKTWPGFAAFVAEQLSALGRRVVVCPGPGEEERTARERFASATLLPGVSLGVYAALMQQAGLMLSNDTGPGHMAAAVGTPLVSVMGPSDPRLWHPWGDSATVLGGHGTWPQAEAVLAACRAALR
jgi:heptosyltransferase II